MRLWSIRMNWLDSIGLVALWRESLLAKAVLEGNTTGYINHPQLMRFRNYARPLQAISTYLFYVYEEAKKRGFLFNPRKIDMELVDKGIKINVSQGQLDYELELLKYKLKARSLDAYRKIETLEKGEPNNIFVAHAGSVENWEKVKDI
ncbi:MAG: pyrimidine dimer DNA glycosylase/endonuclease V [Candidatus Micrarchaeia archaeon]